MSAIGLATEHITTPHLNINGLCQCHCADCTTRTTHTCVCLDCACETPHDHMPSNASAND